MFLFIFRRSRKLAFPRSTKDRRSNTKKLPTVARPRPKTSRFDARAIVAHSRTQSGSGASNKISKKQAQLTRKLARVGTALAHIRIGAERWFGCLISVDLFSTKNSTAA